MKVIQGNFKDLFIADDELTCCVPLAADVISHFTSMMPEHSRYASTETLKDVQAGQAGLKGYGLDETLDDTDFIMDKDLLGKTLRDLIADNSLNVLTYDEFEDSLK